MGGKVVEYDSQNLLKDPGQVVSVYYVKVVKIVGWRLSKSGA